MCADHEEGKVKVIAKVTAHSQGHSCDCLVTCRGPRKHFLRQAGSLIGLVGHWTVCPGTGWLGKGGSLPRMDGR